jgi:hypothetical protein
MEGSSRLFYLLQRYADGSATPEELISLRDLLDLEKNEKISREWLVDQLKQTTNEPGYSEKRLQAVLQAIRGTGPAIRPVRQVWFAKKYWWVAAALLCMLIPAWRLVFHSKAQSAPVVSHEPGHFTQDLEPGRSQAVLTLSNGTKLILDSAHNGLLASQGNAAVIKLGIGKLAYQQTNKEVSAVEYNTLTTPKGGQYRISLPDGSEAWLNAASSIKYPTTFTGDRRVVEVTGEVYFEIAKNAAMPFLVKKVNDPAEIQVLGTHFNINAYDDEPSMKITLLEGSVQVTEAGHHSILQPGQQVQLHDGRMNLLQDVDTDEVMAWKNGKFQFGDASDIKSIMRQIARWYNVDVEYQGTVTKHIGGTISRQVNASKVFNMLELTGAVHFQIEGKKVIVMP